MKGQCVGTAGRHADSLDHGDLKDVLNPTGEVESSGIHLNRVVESSAVCLIKEGKKDCF